MIDAATSSTGIRTSIQHWVPVVGTYPLPGRFLSLFPPPQVWLPVPMDPASLPKCGEVLLPGRATGADQVRQSLSTQPCYALAVLRESIASCFGIGDQLHLCHAYGTQLLIWGGGATHSLWLKSAVRAEVEQKREEKRRHRSQ